MQIINLTTHDVTLSNGYFSVTFPPSGKVARVDAKQEKEGLDYEVAQGIVVKVPVLHTPSAKITNLPPMQEGVYYIVSNYVAQTARRNDLLAPNTDGTAERDSKGEVISVKSFQQYNSLVEKEKNHA